MSALAYVVTPIAGVAFGAAVRSASERRRVVTLCLLPEFPLPGSTKLAVTLGALAVLPLVGFAVWHIDRCPGELRATGAPADWKALPVVAEGSGGSLGRFSLRWQQTSYKNYPAPFENAELADDALCFGSTLSLDSWFGASREVLTHEPAMYRSPSELQLRYEPRRDLYIVSAKAWSEGPEALIVAFRRQLGPRVRFDSLVSLAVFAVGAALFVVGGYGLWRKRNARALTLVLLGASGPFVYEAIADAFELARPGHELRGRAGDVGIEVGTIGKYWGIPRTASRWNALTTCSRRAWCMRSRFRNRRS